MGAGIFKKLEVQSLTISGITNPDYIANTISYTVNHNLGEIPDFVFMYPKTRWVPPTNSGSTNIRVMQYAYYMGIGSRILNGAYENGSNIFIRLYTNQNNSLYEQMESTPNAGKVISNLTSSSIQILGNTISNAGIRNGDYWIMIGKIADAYQQGEQVVVS